MGFPFLGWFFKRIGCGILGVHFSLIYCQIQAIILNIMFDHCFYILLLLLTTKLLWWTIELLLSIRLGVKIIEYQLRDPPRQFMKSKRSIARLQCRTYRCHIKFKKRNIHRRSRCHIKSKKRNKHRRSQRLQHCKLKSLLFLCGWSSYAAMMTHVQSLLQCLHQPPISHDLEIMAKQAKILSQLIIQRVATWNSSKWYREFQSRKVLCLSVSRKF